MGARKRAGDSVQFSVFSRKEFVRHNFPANVLEEKSGLLSQAGLSPYHRVVTSHP